jgi:hypothetical protein
MKRLIVMACISSWSLAGVALAQPLSGTTGRSDAPSPVKSVAPRPWNNSEPVSPPVAGSPGETQASPESRAHQQYLMQSEAAAESVHRAAIARADQRTRRLESQRWFGVSNKRPMCSTDPYDGDYSAYWASNYPFFPLRWVGTSEPWGFVEVQP